MDVTDSLLAYNKEVMNSRIFKLSFGDLGRGLIVAILGPLVVSIIATLGSIISAPGFDVALVDWASLGHILLNISIVSSYTGFAGYLSKQLITSDQGNILGVGDR